MPYISCIISLVYFNLKVLTTSSHYASYTPEENLVCKVCNPIHFTQAQQYMYNSQSKETKTLLRHGSQSTVLLAIKVSWQMRKSTQIKGSLKTEANRKYKHQYLDN